MEVVQNQAYQCSNDILAAIVLQINNISFDDKRLWEFRYKLQYEEPRIKVASSNDIDNLLITWNKDYVEDYY